MKMEMRKIKNYLILILFIIFCNNIMCQSNLTFIKSKIEINNVKVFTKSKSDLIKNFSLKKSESKESDDYSNLNLKMTFIGNRLISWYTESPKIIITNPSIRVGVTFQELKKMLEHEKIDLSDNIVNNLKSKSFQIFDKDENKIIIYLIGNKVYRIIYMEYEDIENYN